jgi:hypothetical protein
VQACKTCALVLHMDDDGVAGEATEAVTEGPD